MQNLLNLLQELKVPNIETTKIMIVPNDKSKTQEDTYQLKLDIDISKNSN